MLQSLLQTSLQSLKVHKMKLFFFEISEGIQVLSNIHKPVRKEHRLVNFNNIPQICTTRACDFYHLYTWSVGDLIASGNILTNPPSGGSINDILYRKDDVNYPKTEKVFFQVGHLKHSKMFPPFLIACSHAWISRIESSAG